MFGKLDPYTVISAPGEPDKGSKLMAENAGIIVIVADSEVEYVPVTTSLDSIDSMYCPGTILGVVHTTRLKSDCSPSSKI